jgi:hypothetical protein
MHRLRKEQVDSVLRPWINNKRGFHPQFNEWLAISTQISPSDSSQVRLITHPQLMVMLILHRPLGDAAVVTKEIVISSALWKTVP